MNTEISGVILQWTLLVALCYPLGRYMAKVYRGERTWLDFMAPSSAVSISSAASTPHRR